LILKEGEIVTIREILEKFIRHRDPVRIKISIPKSTKLVKNSESENDIQMTMQEGEIKFDKPNLLTIINNKSFLKFFKDSLIGLQIFGIIYFSYKIIANIIKVKRRSDEKSNKRLAISDK
jgi:hypothetical protein